MAQYDDEDDQPSAPRFRIMHFTMVMLALVCVSKITEVATAAKELLSVREATASTEEPEAEAAKDDHAGVEKPADDSHGDDAKEEGGHSGGEEKAPEPEKTKGAGKLTIEEVEALKAKEAGSTYTQSELDLLTNLTKRRNELDEREKEIELKTKVLDATEMRITNKVNEMKQLQVELAKVVEQYKTQQNTEIMSLVKIYENMKPGDASAIFNEMDMPILLEVIDKMSVRKVAPILANMDPRKARDVTQDLAEMRRGRASLSTAADAATGTP